MYTVVIGTRCTVYASTKDQSNRIQRINKQGQNLHTKDHVWAYGDTIHVQKNDPIWTQVTCVYKGPTLWGSDAQIEDQSYEQTMHIQLSNPMGHCMYTVATYLCTCEGFTTGPF